jgi:hypothetical protein
LQIQFDKLEQTKLPGCSQKRATVQNGIGRKLTLENDISSLICGIKIAFEDE